MNKQKGAKKQKKLGFDMQSIFCRQIAFITKSGVPLANAHNFIISETKDEKYKEITEEIFAYVSEGSSFSGALKKTGRFSEYLTSVLELGEKTGNLEQSLNELAEYYEQLHGIRRKIRDALTYPAILFIMMFAVLLFLIIAVMPQFAAIISGAGGQLTAPASTILDFGKFLKDYYIYIILIAAVIIAAVIIYSRSASGKTLINKLLFYFPVTKMLVTSRFCSAMKMSLGCGNSISDSLELVNGIIGNSEVEKRITLIKQKVEKGGELTAAVSASGIFPSSFSILFATAYKTGNLTETLEKMAAHYQESFDDDMYDLISKIEPALVIILSCIAAVLLFSVMLPVINIMQMIT